MRSVHLAASALGTLLIALGCGSAPPAAAPGASAGSAEPGAAALAAPITGTRKKLQGTWEIVRYQSDRPISKEAMPLMGELFDSLRLRFEGTNASFQVGKTTEQHPFDVADDDGSEFRLVARGGMFDGARCKFVADDEWQVVDKGERWPGLSVLKRVH